MATTRDDDRDDRDDDRPTRRRDDDPPAAPAGPLDKMFRDTNIVILILFGVCCNGIAFILGLVGLLTAKDPKAKSNAMIVTIIGAVIAGIGLVVRVSGVFDKLFR